jgi:hypothetical protein
MVLRLSQLSLFFIIAAYFWIAFAILALEHAGCPPALHILLPLLHLALHALEVAVALVVAVLWNR